MSGKMLKACWNQPWMTWNTWLLWGRKVKLPSTVQNDIQVAASNEETLSTINWTSFGLKYIRLMEGHCVSYDSPWLSQWNALQLFLLKTIKAAPSLVGTQQVTVIPVSNEAHTDYAWGLLNNTKWPYPVLKWMNVTRKYNTKIRASPHKTISIDCWW